jgi:hypothetical protein
VGVAASTGERTAVRSRTWWAAAALLFAAAFGTNVSTPLLLVYRDRLELSPTVLTAIFGVYALGLAPSLLFAGPASDRYGRTRVLLPATVLVGAASLLFLTGQHSVPMLFAARFVQGLASGAAFSVGSAWLQDLAVPGRATIAARRASLALNVGFCLGPLTAGVLGQYGPAPLVVPYLVHVAIVGVLLGAAVTIARHGAWSAGRRGVAGASLLPRPHLDAAARRVFARTLIPTAICVYAFPSVGVTVLPLTLGQLHHAVAFSGVLAAVTLGSGAVVQPVAQRLGARRGAVGALLGTAGYGLGIGAAAAASMPLDFFAGALLGAGGGLCLNAGLVLVQHLSIPATRGACNGLFYTWAYVGFAAPLLTTSFVAVDNLAVPLTVLTVLTAATSAWLMISPRPSQSVVAQEDWAT